MNFSDMPGNQTFRRLIAFQKERRMIQAIRSVFPYMLSVTAILLALVGFYFAWDVALLVSKTNSWTLVEATVGFVRFDGVGSVYNFQNILVGFFIAVASMSLLLILPLFVQGFAVTRSKYPFKWIDLVWYPSAIFGFAFAVQSATNLALVSNVNATFDHVRQSLSEVEDRQNSTYLRCSAFLNGAYSRLPRRAAEGYEFNVWPICNRNSLATWYFSPELAIRKDNTTNVDVCNSTNLSNSKAPNLDPVDSSISEYSDLVHSIALYCRSEHVLQKRIQRNLAVLEAYGGQFSIGDRLNFNVYWLYFVWIGASLKFMKAVSENLVPKYRFSDDKAC